MSRTMLLVLALFGVLLMGCQEGENKAGQPASKDDYMKEPSGTGGATK